MGRLFWYSNLSKSYKLTINKTSLIIIMLNRIIFLLPLLFCLVASRPQASETSESETFDITVTAPDGETKLQFPVFEKFPAGFDGWPHTPPEECDGFSCNALEYHMVQQDNGTTIVLGQCQSDFPETDFFCFVNEDSSCAKNESEIFSGRFVSFEPCKAHNAPKRRNIWTTFWETVASIHNIGWRCTFAHECPVFHNCPSYCVASFSEDECGCGLIKCDCSRCDHVTSCPVFDECPGYCAVSLTIDDCGCEQQHRAC